MSIADKYFQWYVRKFEPDPPNDDAFVSAYLLFICPLCITSLLGLAVKTYLFDDSNSRMTLFIEYVAATGILILLLVFNVLFRKKRFERRERAQLYRICVTLDSLCLVVMSMLFRQTVTNWFGIIELIFVLSLLGFYTDIMVHCTVVFLLLALASYQQAFEISTIGIYDVVTDNPFFSQLELFVFGPLMETILIPIQGRIRWTMVHHMQRELEVLQETCTCLATMDLDRAESALARVGHCHEPSVVNALLTICCNLRKYQPFLPRNNRTGDSDDSTELSSLDASRNDSSPPKTPQGTTSSVYSTGSGTSQHEHSRPITSLYFDSHRAKAPHEIVRRNARLVDEVSVLTVVLPDIDIVPEEMLNQFVYMVCRVVEQHGGVVLSYQGGRTVSYWTRCGSAGAVKAAAEINAHGRNVLGVTAHSGVDTSACRIGDLSVASCGLTFREL